jgi:hypothetical protein
MKIILGGKQALQSVAKDCVVVGDDYSNWFRFHV